MFNNMVLSGAAYDKCTACSSHVLNQYRTKGIPFVLEVLSDPQVLELVTGLDQMKLLSDNVDIDGDWDE
jgi:ubiquitin-like modifier-activating enzyme ATG7